MSVGRATNRTYGQMQAILSRMGWGVLTRRGYQKDGDEVVNHHHREIRAPLLNHGNHLLPEAQSSQSLHVTHMRYMVAA